MSKLTSYEALKAEERPTWENLADRIDNNIDTIKGINNQLIVSLFKAALEFFTGSSDKSGQRKAASDTARDGSEGTTASHWKTQDLGERKQDLQAAIEAFEGTANDLSLSKDSDYISVDNVTTLPIDKQKEDDRSR